MSLYHKAKLDIKGFEHWGPAATVLVWHLFLLNYITNTITCYLKVFLVF